MKRFNVRDFGRKVATGAGLVAVSIGSAMATPASTTDQVMAKVTEFQTDGATIAGGITLAIFIVAAAKWLRRAK